MKLTRAQKFALSELRFRDRLTWKDIGLGNSSQLYLMEERGLVSRNSHGQWSITDKGRQALEGSP